MVNNHIRSKTAKKLINEIKIEYMKRNKPAPTSDAILKAMIKKYKISKEDLLYDQFIKF